MVEAVKGNDELSMCEDERREEKTYHEQSLQSQKDTKDNFVIQRKFVIVA